MLLVMIVIIGVLYLLVVIGLFWFVFVYQVDGSLIMCDGKLVGLVLIGQLFDDLCYFWGCLLVIVFIFYNGGVLFGLNQGLINLVLVDVVKQCIVVLQGVDLGNYVLVLVDLVMVLGSGFDLQISLVVVQYQVVWVVWFCWFDVVQVQVLVSVYMQGWQFGVLGEFCVNVFEFNLVLDVFVKC